MDDVAYSHFFSEIELGMAATNGNEDVLLLVRAEVSTMIGKVVGGTWSSSIIESETFNNVIVVTTVSCARGVQFITISRIQADNNLTFDTSLYLAK